MAEDPPAPVAPTPAPTGETNDPFAPSIWQAPLVPAALSLTTGIALDRFAGVPLAVSLIAAGACLAAWVCTRRPASLALVCLAGALVALGAALHHAHRDLYASDDLGYFATAEPRPARLRGVLVEEPLIAWQAPPNGLQSFTRPEPTVAVLRATHLKEGDDWLPVSGRARLSMAGQVQGLHVGDRVEVVGRLQRPQGPANPGEFDYAAFLQDQRIRALLSVQAGTEAVVRLEEGWPFSPFGWLAVVRGWGQHVLEETLGPAYSGVGTALLLGEGSTMTRDDWDKYIRTGVIHVLAISGQHLVVLAAFLWGTLRILGVRRRRGAWLVAGFLLTYALLTGGRPPVLRSAVTVCALCGGIFLCRPVLPANSFALAWIVVAVVNPADLFSTGCQLSFLAVALLYWGTSRWFQAAPDALDRLVDDSRPAWLRLLYAFGRLTVVSYAVGAVIWLAVTPLVAARYHLVAPSALLIGPPMVLLSSLALLAGFLLLLVSVVGGPLVPLLAALTQLGLGGCEFLVDHADRLALFVYVPDVPPWWLWGFYPALLAVLVLESLRRLWRGALLAGLGWLSLGLLAGAARPASAEMRCTFLAVGHGCCTVLETPEGRTLLYDAGALAGPDVTRRQIAPFLWHRGIRRLDEVFLSHADLDHFNGLPALLERFAVGQVTCTPSFANKASPGVALTVEALERHCVPVRIVRSGDRLASGSVTFEVLHPPSAGPEGRENFRSLVLRVRHGEHSILLTGDLEGPGLERVLALPPARMDVLMAPHHGSREANRPELAGWCRPRVVISCQGPPRWPARATEPYSARGALFLGTWPHGAVTVRSREQELVVETFVTGQRLVLR